MNSHYEEYPMIVDDILNEPINPNDYGIVDGFLRKHRFMNCVLSIFLTLFAVIWTKLAIAILCSPWETILFGGFIFVLADLYLIYRTITTIKSVYSFSKREYKAQYGFFKINT